MPYLFNDIYELLINNNCKQMFFYLEIILIFLMITHYIFNVIEFKTKPLLKMVLKS